MLNAIFVAIGLLAVGAFLWRILSSHDEGITRGAAAHQETTSDAWLRRIENIQLLSVVVAVLAIPAGFVVMVVTRSGALTLIIASGLPAGGLVFGICQVIKGVIEARDIITQRNPAS